MKRLFHTLGTNRRWFLATLLAALLFGGCSVILPVVSGKLVTRTLAELSLNTPALPIFAAVCLGQFLLSTFDEYMRKNLRLRQKQLMRQNAFRAFSDRGSHGQEEQAGFVSFINVDIPSLAEQYYIGTVDIIECAALLLFSAASLISIHYFLAFVILGISLLMIVIPRFLKQKAGEVRKNYSNQMAVYQTTLQSFLGGLPNLPKLRMGPSTHPRAKSEGGET